MPTPNANETQAAFVNRCVPIVRGEGKPQDQAVAICYSLWTQAKKGDTMGTEETMRDGREVAPATGLDSLENEIRNHPLPDIPKPGDDMAAWDKELGIGQKDPNS